MNDNFDDISEFIDDSEQTGSTFATLKEKLFESSIDFEEKKFFQNPARTQIVKFSLGCHYFGMCHYCEAIQ